MGERYYGKEHQKLSPALISRVIKLAKAGQARPAIAESVGMTTDHVRGIIKRYRDDDGDMTGIAQRNRAGSHVRPRRQATGFRQSMPEERAEPLRFADEPTPADAVKFEELDRRGCKYPFGMRDYRFCGHTRRTGSAYCGKHHAVCYREARG